MEGWVREVVGRTGSYVIGDVGDFSCETLFVCILMTFFCSVSVYFCLCPSLSVCLYFYSLGYLD